MELSMTDPLHALAGGWSGEENIAATRWGPGGKAMGEIVSRLELGGRLLVQDYREERDGKQALQVHAVFVAGAEPNQYSLYWFDSYGFVPAEPAPGHWDGDALVFVRSSPRGKTRHTYRPLDADLYSFTLESSFDEGASWEPVLAAVYHRRIGVS
jgi:hypothetical protein